MTSGLPETGELAGLPGPVAVDDTARTQLLALARTAVAVASRAVPADALDAAMHEASATDLRASAFVTLTEDDDLRGCMGILDPDRPVHDSVAEAAACATRTDPRFHPVDPDELPRLHLDVSVLGPMTPLEHPLAWRLGIDGIVVQLRGRRGLLLPEVATENGLDQVAMLDIATRKAGLPAGAWRDPAARIWAFRTERFGGPVVEEGSSPA
jgi:AmmeMemoRadiSam system protein A